MFCPIVVATESATFQLVASAPPPTTTTQFRFFSNCEHSDQPKQETQVCAGLMADQTEISFTVEIDLAECPSDEAVVTLRLSRSGVSDFVDLDMRYVCGVDWN